MLDGPLGRVLDLGCGPGVLEPYLLDRGQTIAAVDLSPKMIEKAKQGLASHPAAAKLSFFVSSAETLPFDKGSFDTVVCIGVLSYWRDPTRSLAEIARVLRPGGRLVIQGSNLLAPWELESRLLRKPYQRVRGMFVGQDSREADFPLRCYVPARLEARLKRAGLTPVQRRHYDFQLPFVRLFSSSLSEGMANRLLRFSRSRGLGLIATGFLVDATRDE
jgi:SAM-dependent methyltransferase